LPDPLIGFLVALGGGLLIGIERERRKGTGAGRALAGVRTFTLVALAGALAQSIGEGWLVGAGAALVLALISISYWRDRSADPGVTTEVALFVTYLLGVSALERPAAAAGTAVIVASLLAARSRLHRFATEVLSTSELRDALILAGAALVLLPLLPDQPWPWLGGLNLRRIWGLAVLIIALQGGGYVARRWLGAQRGLALAGLASGFVSSTAAIAALGARVRKEPALLEASAASALCSTMATFLQFAVVAAAVHPPSLAALGVPLAAGLLATAAAAGVAYLRARDGRAQESKRGRAFNLVHATLFAIGLAAVTAIVGFVNESAGGNAVLLSAALAGFADAHAAGAAVLGLAADGRMSGNAVLWACLTCITTNASSKIALSFVAGGGAYGLRVSAGIAGSLAAVWLTAYAAASV
jgi:uncharacterized membrane protein (DUF4010 family)